MSESQSNKPLPQSPQSMASEPRHWILIVALGIAAFACYKLIAPYIGSIVMAFIIAILFASLHKRIERGIGGHANTAAYSPVFCSPL